jgi:hypothetical protein
MQKKKVDLVSFELIRQKIFLIRGYKVMLDSDLANLYGVPTKSLNLAVKRNMARFPDDFMIKLTKDELENLRFQIETSSWGGRRYTPYCFTQEGVAMLSSILHSEQAILVNIQIMRVFVKLKGVLISQKELSDRLAEVEGKVNRHSKEIQVIFDSIRLLFAKPPVKEIYKEIVEESVKNPYKRTKAGFVVDNSPL